jgi:ubiquitin-conjugating enzyme (huntingtin interacting protein 2)
MKFLTKVYHPNISSASGAICLDILKDAWTPVLTLKSTLISLQSLLCSPEPSDPQDAEVAKHYMASRAGFDDTARYWTHIYAGGPEPRRGGQAVGPDKGESAPKVAGEAEAAAAMDEIAMAGLERAHVEQFESLGFERAKVVRVVSSRRAPSLFSCGLGG